ncbi:MAG: hypothetical protein ACPL8I_02645 [Chloroflexaceae bacterium]
MPNEDEDARTLNNVALPEFAALYALAVRLIDNTGMDQAQLRAGSVSAQLPLEVPVPDGSAVLGSVEHANGDVTVLFDSDRTAAEVVAFYRMQLTAAGWYEPATRRATGGFVFGAGAAERHWLQFCKGRHGPGLELCVQQRDGQPTAVRLDLRRDGRYEPCAYEERLSPYEEQLPSLKPPAGSRQLPGNGAASSNFQFSDAILETREDLASVGDYYAAQLVAAGWQSEGFAVAPQLVWHSWTFVDREGEHWQGLFLARRRTSLPGEVLLHLRMDRLGR